MLFVCFVDAGFDIFPSLTIFTINTINIEFNMENYVQQSEGTSLIKQGSFTDLVTYNN
jgi:hypothetical protein